MLTSNNPQNPHSTFKTFSAVEDITRKGGPISNQETQITDFTTHTYKHCPKRLKDNQINQRQTSAVRH